MRQPERWELERWKYRLFWECQSVAHYSEVRPSHTSSPIVIITGVNDIICSWSQLTFRLSNTCARRLMCKIPGWKGSSHGVYEKAPFELYSKIESAPGGSSSSFHVRPDSCDICRHWKGAKMLQIWMFVQSGFKCGCFTHTEPGRAEDLYNQHSFQGGQPRLVSAAQHLTNGDIWSQSPLLFLSYGTE